MSRRLLYIVFICLSFHSAAIIKENVVCFKEITNYIINKKIVPNWILDSKDEFSSIYKTPATEIGDWLYLKVYSNKSELVHFSSLEKLNIKFENHTCRLVMTKKKLKIQSGFNDELLKKILNKSKKNQSKGIIYAWSENMPLSKIGLKEVTKVAKELNFQLVDIRESKKQNKNSISSFELKARGLGDHFPSLLVFKNGKLVSDVRPGYDNPKRLRKYLGGF